VLDGDSQTACWRGSRSSTTQCRRGFQSRRAGADLPRERDHQPFPFNGYYDVDDAPEIDGKEWKLEVRGLVENKKSWTLDELYQLPQRARSRRHICVEGWSAIEADRHAVARFLR